MRFAYLVLSALLPTRTQASHNPITMRSVSDPTYSCPLSGSTLVPSGAVIRIEKSDPGTLCTLTRNEQSVISVPVGRSYSGNGWERVAGPFTNLRYDCDEEKSYCEVEIPDKTSTNQDFWLTTYKRTLPQKDMVARFLEQATFGTTPEDLESIEKDLDQNESILPILSKWIYYQIYEVNPTSHRETWRRLVAPIIDTPSREGGRRGPCDVGARWRRAAFGYSDSFKEVSIEDLKGEYSLSIDGIFRTVITNIRFKSGTIFKYKKPGVYKMCMLRFNTFDDFGIEYEGNCEELDIGHPAINFDKSNRPEIVLPIEISENKYLMKKSMWDMVEIMVGMEPLQHSLCDSIQEGYDRNIYAELSNGQILIFEPTLAWLPNTAEDPLDDGGGRSVVESNGVVQCPNVPRTFLNERDCKRSNKYSSCAPTGKAEGKVKLDPEILVDIYQASHNPVYAIVGLPLDNKFVEGPCEPGARSRWKKTNEEACVETLHPQTQQIFRTLINSSKDANQDLKDLYLPEDSICHEHDIKKMQMSLWVDGDCYITIHPDEYNVYSFRWWSRYHPGNTDRSNPIRGPANQGNHELSYPKSHSLSRWNEKKDSVLEYVGRLGDVVPFEDMPMSVKFDTRIAEILGLHPPKVDGLGIVVCGSPGEVANDEISIERFAMSQTGLDRGLKMKDLIQQRKTVWTMVTSSARDQLRQRVAWALSQILVISPPAMETYNTEIFLNYYDIFVRNAFKNYRDILREISYSPQMATMLTYFESKSSEYTWSNGQKQFADENFAREIMQLFTIGLVKINMDGTPILDNQGRKIMTYTNDDITEYSRAWTGFTQQAPRGNVEDREDVKNGIDPMRISVLWRDHFPKLGLDGKHIGDTYPLCSDIPTDAFLRHGAKYRLLGKSKISDDQDLLLEDYDSDITVTILASSSKLRQRLCGAWEDVECTYPSVVELGWNIDCTGVECGLDSIKVIQVDEGVFYEYVRPACVQFPFFEGGKLISRKNRKDESACADRKSAVAASACCGNGNIATHSMCNYTGERVKYPIARSRCHNSGEELCDYSFVRWLECGICCNYKGFFWTDVDCEISIIVSNDGRVAIERQGGIAKDEYDSLTFFRVNWEGHNVPLPMNSCGGSPSCEIVGDFCRCPIVVIEAKVFTSMPSRLEVLSHLHIGGVHPHMIDYEDTITSDDLIVHIFNTDYTYSKNTVFEVDDDFGRKLYLKNMSSKVKIKGANFSFRNTPSFFNAVPEVLDAQYETEATIDHYFYHDNTAPFLAQRFIQRFGVSNPSPGYIERVASAFKTGLFVVSGVSGIPAFGSGQYGCLCAMIVAILMDRESRDVVLDSDPTFGSIREPLVKVISLMRNLDYQQTNGGMLTVGSLQERIGEESYEHPSVFNFYQPEYSSPHLKSASLFSPEAMLLPQAPALVDGMISMIKFGLTSCYKGFARIYCDEFMLPHEEGDYSTSIGRLTFESNSGADVVDDLATILTSGRMSSKTREIIRNQYFAVEGRESALRLAEQLTISSPAFHTTGKSEDVKTIRPESPPAKKTCKRHKAVVHLMLKGGCDSFNVLVPHSKCGRNDLYGQYRKVRGNVAISKKDLLQIDASTSMQQCKKFGLHPSLPFLKTLYDDGDALFFAGIGVLTKFVTKDDYMSETGTLLFAHNTLQEEIGRLDPYQETKETGLMGRLMDELHAKDYNVNAFAIDTSLAMLQGRLDHKAKSAVGSFNGYELFNPSSPNGIVSQTTPLLNGDGGDGKGLFSDIWSSSLNDSIGKNNEMYWAQEKHALSSTFPSTEAGRQLELVAKMIASNECRGSDRDIFYIETGMYDHHFNVVAGLERQLDILNDALNSFVEEIKSHGKWNDVTVVVTSDFGRTLTPNSGKGTDHGWSGHSFILGGEVRGARILGKYPENLTGNNPLDVGRGRLIPTMPWEAPWNAVLGWVGVRDEESLNNVLPNRNSFPDALFDEEDLFHEGGEMKSNCNGEGSFISCNPDSTFYGISGINSIKGTNKRGNMIMIVAVVLVLSIVFGIAIAFERQTGYFQHVFFKRRENWEKCQANDDESQHTFSRSETFHSIEFDRDSSFDSIEVDTFDLFHYKNQHEVEVALGKSMDDLYTRS